MYQQTIKQRFDEDPGLQPLGTVYDSRKVKRIDRVPGKNIYRVTFRDGSQDILYNYELLIVPKNKKYKN